MFIVFEGVDGTGKSTQLRHCQSWLDRLGFTVTVCRDPGSTPLGDRLRELLLDGRELEIAGVSEMFLFMAARAQLVQQVIVPALHEKRIVLCDRFLLSTVVYQGYAGGLDPAEIWRIGGTATGGLQPHLTLVFDASIEVAMHRMGSRLDRMESRGEDFLAEARRGFLAESARLAGVQVIDASGDPAEIQQHVQSVIQPHLPAPPG